jgi:hypothetical protein
VEVDVLQKRSRRREVEDEYNIPPGSQPKRRRLDLSQV